MGHFSKLTPINEQGPFQLTALHYGAKSGSTDVLECLIALGADVNDDNNPWGYTPLHVAATVGFIDGMKVLLAAGSKLDGTDIYGQRALDHARINGQNNALGFITSKETAALKAGDREDVRRRKREAKKIRLKIEAEEKRKENAHLRGGAEQKTVEGPSVAKSDTRLPERNEEQAHSADGLLSYNDKLVETTNSDEADREVDEETHQALSSEKLSCGLSNQHRQRVHRNS